MYDHKSKMTLRKMHEGDLTSLFFLKSESWWGTHKTVIANVDDQKRWYESLPKDQLYMMGEWKWSFSAKLSQFDHDLETTIGVVGYTDIDHVSRTCKISGSIYKECRRPETINAGFSAGVDFAFEVLNMHRIESEVLSYNLPSKRLQEDLLGFKVEGVKRKAVYKCGRYYDSFMLALLREEWQEHPRVKAYGDSCNENFSHDRMDKLISSSR